MARRKKQPAESENLIPASHTPPRPGIDAFRLLKFAGMTLAVVAAVFLVAWLAWSGEEFLVNDDRFKIGTEDSPGQTPAIDVTGVSNANLKAILDVFERDRGRSLFKLDPEDRKKQIDILPWVKSATVRRIWPNRVAVDITERTPIAFIQSPSSVTGSMEHPVAYRPMLIDEDGEILGIKSQKAMALPLLMGVRVRDPKEQRRARARLMLRVMDELAPYRDRIPEVDLSSAPAVTIGYEIEGVTVDLLLGESSWRKHLDYFNKNVDRIRHVLQDNVVLDLTMDERVILKSSPEPPKPGGGGQE